MKFENIIESNNEFLQGKPEMYFSPGRVNLIGEHVDYLGGNVFPTAIDLGTYAFVTKREDDEFHFLSENFRNLGKKISSLKDLSYKESDNWTNYCKGMIYEFRKAGHNIPHGLNILVYGTLPNGAGLSSSASLEILIGTVLNETFSLGIEMLDIVKIAQYVENNFVGVNCGIMDQFAVGMSKKDKAIYLNTNTLEYELVPLVLGEYTLIIANTNKKRALADSKYNERRSECDSGLEILQSNGVSVNQLCDLTINQFEAHKVKIKNLDVRNRVEHAVFENHRTIEAVKSLKEGNILKFGSLMNRSHDSLKDLYEVSCKELDILVDSFRQNGSIGARMTGAGFGGCVVTLVKTSEVDKVIKSVKSEYLSKIGYNANFYPVNTSNGTSKMNNEEC